MYEKDNLIKEDIEVLKFLSKYKMLKVQDAKLIYKTKRYYRQRVNKLIEKEYVKRYKSYIIIDKKGRKALGEEGSCYIKNMQNQAYMDRLKYIASIATITIDSNIQFIPSWDIKEKDKFTETARRYIGKMIIDNKEYLIYYISEKKEHLYIKQLLFDVNKAINYENIIIFVENFDVINKRYSNLVFGKENTFIILDSDKNKEIIKNYEKLDYHELLENIYMQELFISNWDIADFLLEENTYIINMMFINTEKIEKVNWFYSENTNLNKKIEIVTLKENEEKIKEIINEKCKIRILDESLLGGVIENKDSKEDFI